MYPHALFEGVAILPQSSPGELIVLSRVAAASGTSQGGAAPAARSYDGHPWEWLASSPLPLTYGGDGNSTAYATIPSTSSGVSYRLDLYNSSETEMEHAYPAPMRAAARLLLQATFGPTRAELNSGRIGNDSSLEAARAWVHAQMALPITSVREHWRRRVNPRLADGYMAPTGRVRPACSTGSRWHRFAFTLRDRRKTLSLEPLGGGATRFVVDNEVRTEEATLSGSTANYSLQTEGGCVGIFEYITDLTECAQAALSFDLPWDKDYPTAVDDGRDGSSQGPMGCYLEGNGHPGNWRVLKVNVAMSNTAACNKYDRCICKRVQNSTRAEPPLPPSLPAPPSAPLPPVLPGYTDPAQCNDVPGKCCTVIYKGDAGAQCNPVPIWDFTDWTHPGGNIFTKARLCGSVRYNWLSRSSSHGVCDSASFCNPEADVSTLDGFTDAGDATRVGTYVDPHCAPASTRLDVYICAVEEKVGGSLTVVALDTYNSLLAAGKNPCRFNTNNNLRDYFVLPNPTIEFSAPDPFISQGGFAESDAPLSPINAKGAPDAYTLGAVPSGCRLSAKRSAYLQVGGSWYRHDRRIMLLENTVTSPDAGVNATEDEFDGASGTCPAVPKTFLNEDGCVRRATCAPVRFSSARFQLNETSLRMYYTLAGTLAYQVRNLALNGPYDVSPCDAGLSRWMRANGACGASETSLDNDTRLAIETAFRVSTDTNEFMRDLDVQADGNGTCTSSLNGVSTTGSSITINGSCWTHVHPHEGNVYMFSYWAVRHNGNDNFPGPLNPIKKWARSGQTTIRYPNSHQPLIKDRWKPTEGKQIWLMGRFGDVRAGKWDSSP